MAGVPRNVVGRPTRDGRYESEARDIPRGVRAAAQLHSRQLTFRLMKSGAVQEMPKTTHDKRYPRPCRSGLEF